MNKSPLVSIITVNYKSTKELLSLINSIEKTLIKIPYEIIIVDNDVHSDIKSKLKKTITYIQNADNIGFGAANNIGARAAKGENLFFLNPDTEIFSGAVEELCSFLSSNPKVGIVAPILRHANMQLYTVQGSRKLTPLTAMVALSFINKWVPNNLISRNYFLSDWNKKTLQKVDVVPGTALMIRKSLFEAIGEFDEKFFLYFEESDLCKRVQERGFDMYMNPKAQIIHWGGKSTQDLKMSNRVFKQSRFYYFKKHYGLIQALIVEGFLLLNKKIIGVLLLIGIFLVFWYNINT